MIEAELFARPNANWDFGLSATWLNAELDSTLLYAGSTDVIAGIQDGNRLPTSPEFQGAASVTYSWDWSTTLQSFVNLTYQHVGSSFSRIEDEQPNFGTVTLRQFGGPLTQPTFTFNPELPAYDILNARFGFGSDRWHAAVFCNNLTDERAFLSVDRERGRGARVGYLTNQPRTYGVSLLVDF